MKEATDLQVVPLSPGVGRRGGSWRGFVSRADPSRRSPDVGRAFLAEVRQAGGTRTRALVLRCQERRRNILKMKIKKKSVYMKNRPDPNQKHLFKNFLKNCNINIDLVAT